MKLTKKFLLVLLILIGIFVLIFIRLFTQYLKINITPVNTPIISAEAVPITLDATDLPLGNPGAPHTIVEFGAIGCSNCTKLNYQLTNFVSSHPTKIRLFWKDAPVYGLFKRDYTLAHQAVYCAGKQGQLWKFLELAMQAKGALDEPALTKIAEGLKMDTLAWWRCSNSDEAKEKIKASAALAANLGVSKLPAIFIDNHYIDLSSGLDLNDLLLQLFKNDL